MTSSSLTNHPFTKNIVSAWPIVKTLSGLILVGIVLYLQTILFTREEGEALKASAATKEELGDVKADVKVIDKDVQLIKTEIHGFKIEARHTNEQLATIIRFMEAEHRTRTQ